MCWFSQQNCRQYQKVAAHRLAWLLKSAEGEMIMTDGEIKELRRLDKEATRLKWEMLRKEFDKLCGRGEEKDFR